MQVFSAHDNNRFYVTYMLQRALGLLTQKSRVQSGGQAVWEHAISTAHHGMYTHMTQSHNTYCIFSHAHSDWPPHPGQFLQGTGSQ